MIDQKLRDPVSAQRGEFVREYVLVQLMDGLPLPPDGRQTTSFIDNSIEAGILLGGNGAFTPW